mmetsp:Transcript_2653/g.5397  ORF Transcript_2653/g.5397 Transcript_2653/m.5397 type:complete len:320 (+) Transcript_2653:150-1109(+)
MRSLRYCSLDDAHCVAEEEIRMTPEHAAVFVERYTTCGDAGPQHLSSSHDDDAGESCAIVLLPRMGFGLPAYAARTFLECLSPVHAVRMGIANHAWRELATSLIHVSPILGQRVYIAKLQCATTRRDEVDLSRLLRQAPIVVSGATAAAASAAAHEKNDTSLPGLPRTFYGVEHHGSKVCLEASAEHLMTAIQECRAAQRHLALERAALAYVEDALASGLPTKTAKEAHAEALSLGLGCYPKVVALAFVCFGTDDSAESKTNNASGGCSGVLTPNSPRSTEEAAREKAAALEKREVGWRNESSAHGHYHPSRHEWKSVS